ncbi:hypothetical protein [Rhodoblastus sp.]|uniref:hypothetical protein n=1 Tax=Rhodoblastus sp. TaxID=1962975 RepID=UPI0035B3873E
MRKSFIALFIAVIAALSLQPANAFFRAGGFGGFHAGGFHAGDAGGFAHGTYVGPHGAAHFSDAGGFWHGTAAGPDGVYHGGAYGGAWHGGAYYHSPVVVGAYGGGCPGCWGAGAVAAGAVAGAAVATAAAAAWPIGGTYAYLPSGCAYEAMGGAVFYRCGSGWLQPAYGANGVYYRVVPAP